MSETKITSALVAKHGVTPEEFARIQKILGRDPNLTELGIFSVMWSEHCSYKNSKPELKKFPRTAPFILVGAGEENAGIVDIGDGWALAFKIESHNHPSAVEPFQGAATGMGGIIRDIFTMGARPVFGFNSLRFGPIEGNSPTAARNRQLFTGVVAGIAHYGNCIGIPTVGGEVYFDPSYNGNPLVNALSAGILRHDQIQRGKAVGVGNPVVYVGAATGRDGLAGAAFASRELTEESQKDRPAVQVGDPFMEKLLLEACLEVMRKEGYVVGVQDMGAAGLTCSTCETASRGGSGIEIDLALVPKRETGMTPYEIMLSESQERMLFIIKKGYERDVEKIFEKWDLHGVTIGRVTDDGLMRVKDNGKVVAEIPPRALADEAPIYAREAKQPASEISNLKFQISSLPEPKNYLEILPQLLASPTIASKNWVWRQYDHMVQDGTVVLPGSDAAVIRINLDRPDLGVSDRKSVTGNQAEKKSLPPITNHQLPTTKYLAFSTDCNSTYCYLDPYEGGKTAVAEAARNLVCSGARPLAVTNCLNFGNPMKPEVFWQLRRCVEGASEACTAFGTPVTGGNVSLYNESPDGAVDPTPVIGMLGLIDDPKHITTQWFKQTEVRNGDAILLLGEICEQTATLGLGGSEYMKRIHGKKTGAPPQMDLANAKAVNAVVLEVICAGMVNSAHDCSEGGLLVALAECCISSPTSLGGKPTGATIQLEKIAGIRTDALLFGETQSRIILSCSEANVAKIQKVAARFKVPCIRLGEVGGNALQITIGDEIISWPVTHLFEAWNDAIARMMHL